MNNAMSRRPRRSPESERNGLPSAAQQQTKTEVSSIVSACVLFITMVLFFGYLFGNSAFHHHSKSSSGPSAVPNEKKFKPSMILRSLPVESHPVTTADDAEDEDREESMEDRSDSQAGVLEAIPLLQEAYGKSMKRVLHVGPRACDVVARLLQDEGTLAWGVEPSELKDPSSTCNGLVRKGLVRVADVFRGIPYRTKSFSVVLASNTLEHLTSRQLNRTLPELARLTSHAIVAFISSQPSQTLSSARQLQAAFKPIKSHNRTWWTRKFETAGLDEDEERSKEFAILQSARSVTTSDYIFLLLPRQLDR